MRGKEVANGLVKYRLQTYVAPSSDSSEIKSQYSVELPLEPKQYDYPLGFDLMFIAANVCGRVFAFLLSNNVV